VLGPGQVEGVLGDGARAGGAVRKRDGADARVHVAQHLGDVPDHAARVAHDLMAVAVGDRKAQAVRDALVVGQPLDHLVESSRPAAEQVADVPRHVAGRRHDTARGAFRDGERRGREQVPGRMPRQVWVVALVPVGEQAAILGVDVRLGGVHPERLEHPSADQLGEREAGARLERVPERVVADVRIPEPGSRLPLGLGVCELGDMGRRRRAGLGS
jgi:hypothetical protein